MPAPVKYAENTANIFLGVNSVKVDHSYNAPAFVHVPTKRMFFNFARIFPDENKITVKQMMVLNGLLFHETLHIKHTVRAKRFKNTMNHQQINLMGCHEDGRIETLGILEYPKMADYFTFAVNEILLRDKSEIGKDKSKLAEAYILCYGRLMYFPDMELVAQLRISMIKLYGIKMVEQLEQLIDEYIFEDSCLKRYAIVKKVYELLREKGASVWNPKNSQDDILSKKDEKSRKTKQEKELEQVLKESVSDKEDANKEMKDIMDDIMDSMDEKAIKEMQDLIDKIDKARSDLADKRHQAGEENDIDKRKELWDKIDELEDEVKDLEVEIDNQIIEAQAQDEQKIQEQIEENEEDNQILIEKNMVDLSNDIKTAQRLDGSVFSDDTFNVSSVMKQESKKLEKGLKELSTTLKSGYADRQTSGRLNVRRMFNRSNPTDMKVFTKFRPSRLAKSKMLINMFVDCSGSMRDVEYDAEGNRVATKWEIALDSCWVINDALNRDANKIMVYAFSTDYMQIKEYDGKLENKRPIMDLTYLAPSLVDAMPRIRGYQKANDFRNVVNIVITDGHLHDNVKSNNIFGQLEKAGHHNIMIGVGVTINPERYSNIHHVVNLHDFGELSGLLMKVFKTMKAKFVKEVKI